MIRFSLACARQHSFDSWFQSADAYERLRGQGLVACSVCGDTEIGKALMAPAVLGEHGVTARPLDAPGTEVEAAIAAFRRQVEADSDYVGLNFVAEARAMHAGDAPERSIYGEARREDARALLEDGIPVAPLPFRPARKSN